jgi:hypothetical protein
LRPAVDVVMPFAGPAEQLERARAQLARLALRDGDTVTLADNRKGGEAGARPGSYFARNRGAERGRNPWIVFLDADVEVPPSLLDDYFSEPVGKRVAVLAGAVGDEQAADGPAALYASRFSLMSQQRTFERPGFAFAQTANCAVRREAFERVGAFAEEVRSGGDADLCFRLRAAGWEVERRERAAVVHRSRRTVRALLRQRARVGAGARWLEQRYPGFAPRRPLARVLAGDVRQLGRAALLLARGERERAILKALEGLADAAFHLGGRLPNRPRRRSNRR